MIGPGCSVSVMPLGPYDPVGPKVLKIPVGGKNASWSIWQASRGEL